MTKKIENAVDTLFALVAANVQPDADKIRHNFNGSSSDNEYWNLSQHYMIGGLVNQAAYSLNKSKEMYDDANEKYVTACEGKTHDQIAEDIDIQRKGETDDRYFKAWQDAHVMHTVLSGLYETVMQRGFDQQAWDDSRKKRKPAGNSEEQKKQATAAHKERLKRMAG